ncbi:MAG: precorrin-8X methylmutase [Lachnospiraceae bacterium]|nr:precorrin-8X methylmutase [Lachnospiraceae bacterium]
MKEIEKLLPQDIEKRSFEIIGEELEKLGVSLPKEEELITKRVIHTSADFDYVKTLKYSKDAVEKAHELLKAGAHIVTDTNMALAGINKRALARLGGEAHCFMADEEVAKLAKERGTTRAAISMEKARKIDKPVIFAIGNAPTALVQIYEMMKTSDWRPAFVIGVPVGFVNVEVSKELIMETDIPYIVNAGRKGGSNVAAAICNALMYEITER